MPMDAIMTESAAAIIATAGRRWPHPLATLHLDGHSEADPTETVQLPARQARRPFGVATPAMRRIWTGMAMEWDVNRAPRAATQGPVVLSAAITNPSTKGVHAASTKA